MRMVVDNGEVSKNIQIHAGSIPNMENTLARISKCRLKNKMNKRSRNWQVNPSEQPSNCSPL